jgi:hypothetical protein
VVLHDRHQGRVAFSGSFLRIAHGATEVRAFLDFAQKRFGKPPYWDPDWTEHRQKTSHDVTE